MSIDSELRRVGASTREAVASGIDVEAKLDELKATSRRRRGRRTAARLAAAAAAAVVMVAGLVQVKAGHDPSPVEPDLDRQSVTCAEAMAGTVAGGTVQCLAPRLVLVRGPVDYTFRLPLGVAWRISPSGAPATLAVRTDPFEVTGGAFVLIDVRAAAGEGGRELPAAQLASWVATRPFLESTPVVTGAQDGLPTWTVGLRPRTDLPRPGPGRACEVVSTECRKLLLWRQGGAGREFGVSDGQVSRWTFVDVPGRRVVALVSWADESDPDLLDEGADLLRSVDFLLPTD